MKKIAASLNGLNRFVKLSQIQMAVSNGEFMDVSISGKWYTTTLTKKQFEELNESKQTLKNTGYEKK